MYVCRFWNGRFVSVSVCTCSLRTLRHVCMHVPVQHCTVWHIDRRRQECQLLREASLCILLCVISRFRLVPNVVFFLLGHSPESGFYMPTCPITHFHRLRLWNENEIVWNILKGKVVAWKSLKNSEEYFSNRPKCFGKKTYKCYKHINNHVWCISTSDSLGKSIY